MRVIKAKHGANVTGNDRRKDKPPLTLHRPPWENPAKSALEGQREQIAKARGETDDLS
jgi:hypothetical protein